MYARMKAKKNEPLSSISQRRPRASGKEVIETSLSVLALPKTKATSPAVSLEEITPRIKRTCNGDKGKSKADASVWDDIATALGKAHNVITTNELKGLSAVPHPGLDFEEVDKEMEADESAEAVSAIGNVPDAVGGAPNLAVGDDTPAS
nr:hypothetical protein CFP56_59502 [Quercus suber]